MSVSHGLRVSTCIMQYPYTIYLSYKLICCQFFYYFYYWALRHSNNHSLKLCQLYRLKSTKDVFVCLVSVWPFVKLSGIKTWNQLRLDSNGVLKKITIALVWPTWHPLRTSTWSHNFITVPPSPVLAINWNDQSDS